MKAKIEVTARPGSASGRMTRRKRCQKEQPSTIGGFFDFGGHVLEKSEHQPDHEGKPIGDIGNDQRDVGIAQVQIGARMT